MLFSSLEFIFVFLPITFCGYYLLSSKFPYQMAKGWLLFCSLIFYAYWHPANVLLIIGSILFNFLLGKALFRRGTKSILVMGIIANLALLFYYKYSDFFLSNVNAVFGSEITLLHVALPLGISFFTFQQIAFLVDNYNRKIHDFKFVDYSLFVSFFPQLIAGPIVHHGEMMPQFAEQQNHKINWDNIAKGIFVFNMGLAKKLVIADSISLIVANGYGNTSSLGFLDSWVTSFAYSIQLYFDFSGYSDMAIGLGLLFNIKIPLNFNSPYKAKNIQDFWRRWHITLSVFLRDYIYIPFGGSRGGEWITSRNLVITFLLGGIWHGAGWTFILWGLLHGIALVIQRNFSKLSWRMPNWMSIMITFLFVNFAWVFFRASSWTDAINLIQGMTGFQQGAAGYTLIYDYYYLPIWIASVFLLFRNNTHEIAENFEYNRTYLIQFIGLIILNLIFLNSSVSQEFLYFDF